MLMVIMKMVVANSAAKSVAWVVFKCGVVLHGGCKFHRRRSGYYKVGMVVDVVLYGGYVEAQRGFAPK